jgi:hypothetical protein
MAFVILDVGIVSPLGPVIPIRSRDPKHQRFLPFRARDIGNLEREAQSVLERSSVLVLAIVGDGRQEVWKGEKEEVWEANPHEKRLLAFCSLCNKYPYTNQSRSALSKLRLDYGSRTHMGSVYLDKVETDLVAPINGIREGLFEILDLFQSHGLRLRISVREGDRRGGLDW